MIKPGPSAGRHARRAPIDTSGARAPTSSEIATAENIVARSGVLEALEEKLDAPVGRPRVLSVKAALVAMQINALRRHHQAHLVEVARILNALSETERRALGVNGRWDPDQTYDRLDRLFLRLDAVLKEGWWSAINGQNTWVDTSWVGNRLVRAGIGDGLPRSGSLAIDGTDVESWGALRGDVDTIVVDGDEDGAERDGSGPNRAGLQSRVPKRRAEVLGVGQDGRRIYTRDPDARAGHRSSTNSRQAGLYVGYEAHFMTQVHDVGWSDGVERLTFAKDVPPFITGFSVSAAGSHRGHAVVPEILATKSDGWAIEHVVWDPGYSLLKPESTSFPLAQAGISQTFRPTKWQRAQTKPFTDDAILIEGHLFSRFLPQELREPLPMPPRGASVQQCSEYEKAFNRRAAYRFSRHAGPDSDGTTRWRCPFHSGFLRARELPWTMRKRKRSPLVRDLPEGTTRCCTGIKSVAAAELPLWQPYLPGTTAWRISMGRRQLAETSNSAMKGRFVHMARGFFRVFTTSKLTLLMAFTLAGHNVEVARSFLSRLRAKDGGDPVRRRAKRRKGTWADIIPSRQVRTGPDPPAT